ncbi:MAG: cellulase N-terminal Ig-like domain-containing protein [bacterium]
MLLAIVLLATSFSSPQKTNTIHLRDNQIGYLPEEPKIAVAFSQQPADKRQFEIVEAASATGCGGRRNLAPMPVLGEILLSTIASISAL